MNKKFKILEILFNIIGISIFLIGILLLSIMLINFCLCLYYGTFSINKG